MATEKVPARIQVIVARDVGTAVILRRGPTKQVCTIGWNLEDDSFQMGQWLKGAIAEDRCDLSPDGKHLIYEAKKYFFTESDFKFYTVLSRAPFLKALKIWKHAGSYAFGGCFLDSNRFWINENKLKIYHLPDFKKTEDTPEMDEIEALRYQFPLSYWLRKRDGWQEEHFPEESTTAWTKQIKNWKLSYTVFLNSQYKKRTPDPWIMRCEKTGESFETTGWEWADLYGKRLLFAHRGKIFAVRMWESGHGPITLLRDFNHMKFEPIVAPY